MIFLLLLCFKLQEKLLLEQNHLVSTIYCAYSALTHTPHTCQYIQVRTQTRIGCVTPHMYISVDRPAQFADVLNGLIMYLLSCSHLPMLKVD